MDSNFPYIPDDEEIHKAFQTGEHAVKALFVKQGNLFFLYTNQFYEQIRKANETVSQIKVRVENFEEIAKTIGH